MPNMPTPAARFVAAPSVVITEMRAHAANYSPKLRMPKDIQAVTLHATHGIEGPRGAEQGAREIQAKLDRERSCHYFVDSDSVVQCVPEHLTAWHCGHQGNLRTIGIELCGSADQTRAQWLDAVSVATLALAARLTAQICMRYGIPPAVVTPTGLRAGQRGITTHAFISQSWHESDHYDPGPWFPLGEFIAAVEAACTAAMP